MSFRSLVSYAFLVIGSLTSIPSQAFVIGTVDNAPVDYARETHLFVVGYAHGQGDNFFRAALSRARRERELSPHAQIVLMRANDGGEGQSLKSFGLTAVIENSDELTGARFVSYARKFAKLASLNAYTHSGAITGIGLEGSEPAQRLSPRTPGIDQLKGNFAAGAFATLNGCNGGWQLAQAFSKLWGIPVSGALTGTDFQGLAKDSDWYFNNSGEYPSSGFKSTNDASYDSAQGCKSSGCLRMKPTNKVYQGYWGDYKSGGLGFYKFFCNFDGAGDECLKGMAKAVLGYPSVRPVKAGDGIEQFKEVAQDWLCPISASKASVRADCVKSLQAAEAAGASEVYSPFIGNPVECGLKACNAQMVCQNDASGEPLPGTCGIQAPTNHSPKTIVQEYKRLLQGFAKL